MDVQSEATPLPPHHDAGSTAADAVSIAALEPFVRRHGAFLEKLGIRDRPWLILGSAPDPCVPEPLRRSHARIDINNAGRTAAALNLGRADLTIRAKKKSWDEHPHVDTRGLIWIHTVPPIFLRLLLLGKPHDHVGRVTSLTRRDRDRVVTLVSGAPVEDIGDLGKVTNGVAAACYGLMLGVPEIVLAGVSLSKTGHSYDQLGRVRRQVEEDAFILDRLKGRDQLSTTEPDLSREAGLRLWTP